MKTTNSKGIKKNLQIVPTQLYNMMESQISIKYPFQDTCQPGQVPNKNVRQLALRPIWSSAQLTLAHLLYAVFFLFFDVFFAFVFAHSPLACWLLQVGIILEMSSSMAGLVSYNVGACKMIPDVPTEQEGGVRCEHFLLSFYLLFVCVSSPWFPGWDLGENVSLCI